MSHPRAHSKRDDLITAALRLFAEKGIKATTVRDMAHEAGVTEGALYRHFESKEQLARALFAECARLFYQRLSAALEGVSGADNKLCALVQGFFGFAETHPAAYEYVMARHHDDLGGLAPDQPLPKDLIVKVIEEGIAAGQLRPLDHELGAAMIVGICIRTIFFLDQGMIRDDREQVMREVCEALQRVFDIRPPSRRGRRLPRSVTRT
jgi:AcrR family transcriptional regulator